MSLPDGTEYWWGVKGYDRKEKFSHTHIKGCQCGHFHIQETSIFREVDCSACRKIVSEMGNIFNLDMSTEKEAKEQRRLEKIQSACSCGGKFVKRTNKSSREEFYGCSRYPKCKKTKNKL